MTTNSTLPCMDASVGHSLQSHPYLPTVSALREESTGRAVQHLIHQRKICGAQRDTRDASPINLLKIRVEKTSRASCTEQYDCRHIPKWSTQQARTRDTHEPSIKQMEA